MIVLVAPFTAWALFDVMIARIKRAEAETATLAAEIEALKRPTPAPSRNPNGIYQHNVLVGSAQGATLDISQDLAEFRQLIVNGDFNWGRPFEYQDWELRATGCNAEATAKMSGVQSTAYHDAYAKLLRKRPA